MPNIAITQNMTLFAKDLCWFKRNRYSGHQIGSNHISGCRRGIGEISATLLKV